MMIRLTRPYALFFPNRVENAGSVHSIGTPKGQKLVASGLAETVTQPPDSDVGSMDRPIATSPLSAEANALIAALSRRARRRRTRAKPTGAYGRG